LVTNSTLTLNGCSKARWSTTTPLPSFLFVASPFPSRSLTLALSCLTFFLFFFLFPLIKKSMRVVNYNWGPRTSAEIRKKVLDGLMPFIEQNVMYERILKKEMLKMTLHADSTRFLRKDALEIRKGAEKVRVKSASR